MGTKGKSIVSYSLNFFWEGLLELLFPASPACPLCGKTRQADEMKRPLCRDCQQLLDIWRTEPHCRVCGRKIQAGQKCPACRRTIPSFFIARSAAPYDGVFREAVQRLKFKKQQWLAKPLGQLMAEEVEEEPLYGKLDLAIPVPLFPKGLAERTFNQSELLAAAIGEAMGLPLVTNALVKTKETKDQIGLSRRARQANLRGAFQVRHSGSIEGKNLLLVDDIFTTGSTVAYCSKALLKAGAERVAVITWAGGTNYY